MFRALWVAALGFSLAAPFSGWAADKKEKGPQVINFEDDTIQGDLTKPDGEYIEAKNKVQHANLIRIREEFKDKVLKSVSDL